MPAITLDNRTGGLALVVGYVILIAALFRDPTNGLATATATVQGIVFFVALPVLGVASGVYAYVDGPLQTLVTLLTGTYLATVGIALTLFLSGGPLLTVVGLVLFGLAAVAILGALMSALSSLGLNESLL
ncbi:hypothetical protein [Halomicrobium katesii]|uniref:hypothetical protein n=1 Tax=Halomicrobium katesii TaxID=437163 RepID=UPI0012BAB6D4|nr:hypothetical protein [Halomicrobium katesii]